MTGFFLYLGWGKEGGSEMSARLFLVFAVSWRKNANSRKFELSSSATTSLRPTKSASPGLLVCSLTVNDLADGFPALHQQLGLALTKF